MTSIEPHGAGKTLIVRSHVTPWGFLVALPLAFAFAYVGALTLDAPIVPPRIEGIGDLPFWLFSAILLAFALLLFLIGIAELAAYLKPAVQVVIDDQRLTTWGVMGARQFIWNDILAARVDDGQLVLRARGRKAGKQREARLHFSRLQIDPKELLAQILVRRPDIAFDQRPT
ncbi:MAG: hypothetical protein R3D67_07815 [Hyphomicrobiaceae bacterium]